MVPSRLRLPVLAAALSLALAALGVAPSSSAPKPRVPDDLPMSEVVRLSDEARASWNESKASASRPGAAGLAAGRPLAITADSLHAWDARHYRLDVTPSRTSNLITGTMTVDLRVVDPAITAVDLFANGISVGAARVNGVSRTFSQSGDRLFVPICEAADCPAHGAGDSLQVSVDYSAAAAPFGLYFYARNTYTMSEPFDGRYWWPCYDLPNDKATLDVYATAPDSNVAVSNGLLISVDPGPPGKKIWHWRETHPISTYLVAVTVGNFWQWTQTAGALPILENVFPEDSTKAKFDFANVPSMIAAFSARWGPYAFDKYGMVAVTPFGFGGMEHQSLTTINRSWVTGTRSNETGVAHELAHQWWGDKVTLVDFRNVWLNEGFASYGECEWEEDFYGPASYDSYVQSQMTSALNSDNNQRYALYDPPAANLFGNTIYKKGSLVLHMLRRVLGDASFFAGMQLYGQRFQYGNASTADFERAMEDASGQPLDWYFNEWVYDKGLPTYTWGWQARPDPPPATATSTLAIAIRQTQTNAPYFRMPIEFRVTRAGGRPDTTVIGWNDATAAQTLLFTLEGTVTNVVFDPRNSIYKRIQQVTVGVPFRTIDPGPSVSLRAESPARGAARLLVRLGSPARVPIEIRIYDSAGRAIRALGERRAGATDARFDWDLRDRDGNRVAPGLYFAQARVGGNHEERPIVVLQ